jgi:aspartate-semialdehyde dehydrogenase
MTHHPYTIAIVGATGLVGATLIQLIQEKKITFDKIYLVASQHSEGQMRDVHGVPHPIYDLSTFDFKQTQLAFFCVERALALEYAIKAASHGNIVIDKSDGFRGHPDVPLVIPEVNAHALSQYRLKNIISSPNCSTIPIAMALKPLHDAVGIQRVNISTYQSVSGTGRLAIDELTQQTKQILNGETVERRVYPQQIAFNVLPHIDDFEENGYTREEMKMVSEIKKIFHDDTIAINPTAVRVPVYYGHAASLHLETRAKITAAEACDLFSRIPGIQLMTGPTPYGTPVHHAAGQDTICVGRVREDVSHPTGLNLWVVTDNLRKGAALNSIHIAEHLMKERAL